MDTNTLGAIATGCVTLLTCIFFLSFQSLIKAHLFKKIRCGACQGEGRVVTHTSTFAEHREYAPCATCSSTGYIPFKI